MSSMITESLWETGRWLALPGCSVSRFLPTSFLLLQFGNPGLIPQPEREHLQQRERSDNPLSGPGSGFTTAG